VPPARPRSVGAYGSLNQRQVLSHPFVIGKLALGRLRQRNLILEDLRGLPSALVAHEEEVHAFIDRHKLFGTRIGYIDVYLLAATVLTPDLRFWTSACGLLRCVSAWMPIWIISLAHLISGNQPGRTPV
jgi:hypothetical protein